MIPLTLFFNFWNFFFLLAASSVSDTTAALDGSETFAVKDLCDFDWPR